MHYPEFGDPPTPTKKNTGMCSLTPIRRQYLVPESFASLQFGSFLDRRAPEDASVNLLKVVFPEMMLF